MIAYWFNKDKNTKKKKNQQGRCDQKIHFKLVKNLYKTQTYKVVTYFTLFMLIQTIPQDLQHHPELLHAVLLLCANKQQSKSRTIKSDRWDFQI